MEQDIKVTSNTLVKVKEIVDFLFEATVTEGGYKGGWSKYSTRFRKIAHILVKRGVLIKEGNQMHTTYKWNNAAMCPTKPFYKSVAQEMVKGEREVMARSYQKKKREKAHAESEAQKAAVAAEKESVREEVPVEVVPFAGGHDSGQETAMGVQYKENPLLKPDMRAFTEQELWDELKRRGARIVDGKMKVVKEVELA